MLHPSRKTLKSFLYAITILWVISITSFVFFYREPTVVNTFDTDALIKAINQLQSSPSPQPLQSTTNTLINNINNNINNEILIIKNSPSPLPIKLEDNNKEQPAVGLVNGEENKEINNNEIKNENTKKNEQIKQVEEQNNAQNTVNWLPKAANPLLQENNDITQLTNGNRGIKQNTSNEERLKYNPKSNFNFHKFSEKYWELFNFNSSPSYFPLNPTQPNSPEYSPTDYQLLDLDVSRWNSIRYRFQLHTAEMDITKLDYLQSCAGPVALFSKKELSSFTVAVFGSSFGYLSNSIAKSNPNATVLSLENNQTKLSIHHDLIRSSYLQNNLLFHNRLTADLIDALYTSDTFFRFQIVIDIVGLLDELIHHEFELAFGKLLTLSQTTFFFIPDDIEEGVSNHLRYFEHWSSFRSMITSSFARVSNASLSIESLERNSLFRIDVSSEFRRSVNSCLEANRTHCETPKAQELVFQYNHYNKSLDYPTVQKQWTDGTHKIAHYCNGVTLHQLNLLQLIPYQRDQLYSYLSLYPFPQPQIVQSKDDSENIDDEPSSLSLITLMDQLKFTGWNISLVDPMNNGVTLFKPPKREISSSSPSPTPSSNHFFSIPSPVPIFSDGFLLLDQLKPNAVGDIPPAVTPFPIPSLADKLENSPDNNINNNNNETNNNNNNNANNENSENNNNNNNENNNNNDNDNDDDVNIIRKLFATNNNNNKQSDFFENLFSLSDNRIEAVVMKKKAPIPESPPEYTEALQRFQSISFDHDWHILKPFIDEIKRSHSPSPQSWMIGDSELGYFTSKLSKLFPSDHFLSVSPLFDDLVYQRSLLDTLSLHNVLLGQADYLDLHLLEKLVALPTMFRYQLLSGRHLFALSLKYSQSDYQLLIGRLLAMSATSLFILPNSYSSSLSSALYFNHLNQTIPHNLTDDEIISQYVTFFRTCAKIANINDLLIHIVPSSSQLVVKIDLISSSRHIVPSLTHHSSSYSLSYSLRNSIATWSTSPNNNQLSNQIFGVRFDLETIIELGLHYPYRRFLLFSYLELDLFVISQHCDELLPSYLFIHSLPIHLNFRDDTNHLLFYSPHFHGDKLTSRSPFDRIPRIDHILKEDDFSMLILNSGRGELSTYLSYSYPNSTVINIEKNNELILSHQSLLDNLNLHNNIICNKTLDSSLLNLFHRSPEYFQYGVLLNTTRHLRTMTSSDFGNFLGIFAGITKENVIEFPSSLTLSLAAQTLFVPRHQSLSYSFADHPTSEWAFSSIHLLQAILHNEGLFEVDVKLFTSPSLLEKEYLHIKVLNMTRNVRHHFLLQGQEFVDRHARTYNLFNVNEETYLIRSEDGRRIEYDTFGISLIALLRLSISEENKLRFYHQFLSMPIREDMAPWNIQFRGGKLEYVDKDSLEDSFDAFVPKLYQILNAVINYKRTLEDFKVCKNMAQVKGNIPLVGECVGSNLHSCTDAENPVPCADGGCYPSFIECFRSLENQVGQLENKIENIFERAELPVLNIVE